MAVCLLVDAAGTRAALEDSPVFDAEVLQGGFYFDNPDAPELDAGLVSLGPLVAGGARTRTVLPGGAGNTCADAIYVLLGARGTTRKPTTVTLRQSRHVVVFFVLTRCDAAGDGVCLEGASEAVAVRDCSGSVKLSTRRGIVGKTKIRCKRGIDTADPAFALSADERARLEQAFPDLGRAIRLRFTDTDGEKESEEDLQYKLRNVNVQSLENIVGTYLDDDQLPACLPVGTTR
jgi:hypothetical protein